jgi:hypothetical protein
VIKFVSDLQQAGGFLRFKIFLYMNKSNFFPNFINKKLSVKTAGSDYLFFAPLSYFFFFFLKVDNETDSPS